MPVTPAVEHRHGHDVGEQLYIHRHTPIHLLPAEVKILALVMFMFIVVATPVQAMWAFVLYAGLLVVLAAVATLPPRVILPRMVVEVPFLLFAALMPFTGPDPQVQVLGLELSEPGLWAAWGIVAKGTIGVLAAIILAATTPARDLLTGLKALHVPPMLVQIASFMLRYMHVVGNEMARMKVARESRGFQATGVRSWPVLAPIRRGAVHPLLRARGAGPPGDAQPRLHRQPAHPGRPARQPGASGWPGSACPRSHWSSAWPRGRSNREEVDVDPEIGTTGSDVPPSLAVSGLAYAYPDGHQALFGVDLHVGRGERVALLGPNGAGKTTLVLHLNGILSGGIGEVHVAGIRVDPENRDTLHEVRRRVGIVFQDPDDQLFMPTVREDVAFGPANLGLRGAELEARVAEALDLVGMAEFADRPPHHLSFGQRRRVAVATVLAMEPEILVLDEPSSNLDPASRAELADILRALDVTMLMVTHDLPYALELCPRSVILSDGAIVADGPTRDLLGDADLMARYRLALPYGVTLEPKPTPG